ncbi:DEAD/DEAH box helicase [Solimicrobium silvestre]|uniref:DEAD-box ATP-dependent RNA helicase RhpA n=1 Tax=Solimicrobium silvestre TaxID=2099400 RepID=A0A2S9GYK5_9BURK|nr:DEAD/DEAH box helicase [Solimicrobium silvestre]PRC92807.1 Superfamily II DNA and RNA helicase [Solimicrobium silvestre]
MTEIKSELNSELSTELSSITISTSSSAEVAADVRFADFGLSDDILRALSDQGYVHPTPIQAAAIPVVLEGRDVMGAAQTGTGKTAGFSLPIIQLLLAHANASASPARHPVRALILTPTRELADQVAENVKAYCKHTPLRSLVVFGGVDIAPQTAALRAGVEIVIATPGRLLDHVQQKTINLSQVQILVMDEADRMLDMGFLPDLQRIINLLPKARQSLMFSATFSQEIKKLAATFLRNPLTIEVARSNATAENVTQILYQVQEEEKRDAVSFIIRERNLKQVIVFSNTKIGTSRLAVHLVKTGVKAAAIHGDKTQQERMAALESFKRGEIEVLVATDVAARGLDIAELPCVINFDLPYNAEDYVHRIGRTGRAGATGDAISLFTEKDERLLADIEKLIKQKIVRLHLAGFVATKLEPHGLREPRSSGARSSSSGSAEVKNDRRVAPRSYASTPKIDPWFLQPYQPTASTLPVAEKPSVTSSSGKPAKRAALLGGFSKS